MRLPSWLLCVALAVCPLVARAQSAEADLDRARKLFAQAEELEERKDWAGALALLEQTAAITMTPGIRYHIAYCKEHLGQLLDARRNYATAVREAKASKKAAAKGVIAIADQRFVEVAARIPHVMLRVSPSEARPTVKVLVDARPANVLPSGTFEIDPGEHDVEVSAADFEAVRLHLSMAEKELREMTVVLRPSATVPAPEPTSPTSDGHLPSGARQPKARVGAILATSAAALSAGFGVGAYLMAGSSHDDAKAACATQPSPCDGLKTSTRTWDALALGAWIGAAALGVTASILWIKPDRSSSSTKLSVGPSHFTLEYHF